MNVRVMGDNARCGGTAGSSSREEPADPGPTLASRVPASRSWRELLDRRSISPASGERYPGHLRPGFWTRAPPQIDRTFARGLRLNSCDCILAMVHPVRAVLAGGDRRAGSVPDRVVAVAAAAAGGNCRRRSAPAGVVDCDFAVHDPAPRGAGVASRSSAR